MGGNPLLFSLCLVHPRPLTQRAIVRLHPLRGHALGDQALIFQEKEVPGFVQQGRLVGLAEKLDDVAPVGQGDDGATLVGVQCRAGLPGLDEVVLREYFITRVVSWSTRGQLKPV